MLGYWEKVDKKRCLELLAKTEQLIGYYERCHSLVLNKVVPAQLHSAIKGLSSAIAKSKSYYTWYSHVKDIYDALAALDQMKHGGMDTQEAARAFGKLFVALSVVAAEVPMARVYAQALQVIGSNFEGIVRTLNTSTHGSEGLDDDYKAFLGGKQSFINSR